MAQKQKFLNLNFHQIVPAVQTTKEAHEKGMKAISEAFNNLPENCRPIIRSESEIELYKKVEFRQNVGLYLGSLINNQTSGIAAKYKRSNQTLTPLGLAEDEGLGHPVNFLFDPEVNVIMMESVRNGVSVLGLVGILMNNVDLPKLDAAIVINPAKMEEFYKMKYFKKFKVRIARLENGNIFNQKRKKAVMQIASSADNTDTDFLEYTLGVSKKNDSLNPAFVKNAVQGLLGFKDTQEVELLEVAGKEEEDGRIEPINLIEHSLRDHIPVDSVRLHGDFAREERFEQLINTYNKHKEALRRVYKLKPLA